MNNSNISTNPRYAYEPDLRIPFWGQSVPKALYDSFWEQASRHIAKMNPDSDLCVWDVLDNGVYDYLNKDGIKAVERCLEHWAMEEFLPITSHGHDDDGNAMFTVK